MAVVANGDWLVVTRPGARNYTRALYGGTLALAFCSPYTDPRASLEYAAARVRYAVDEGLDDLIYTQVETLGLTSQLLSDWLP